MRIATANNYIAWGFLWLYSYGLSSACGQCWMMIARDTRIFLIRLVLVTVNTLNLEGIAEDGV